MRTHKDTHKLGKDTHSVKCTTNKKDDVLTTQINTTGNTQTRKETVPIPFLNTHTVAHNINRLPTGIKN